LESTTLDLTDEQLAAAEACGCTVAPATDDQLRRLTVQRRIFRVGGKPFVAICDGFHETHATLAALIAERMRAAPVHPAEGRSHPAPAPQDRTPPRAAEGHAAARAADAPEPAVPVAPRHRARMPSEAARGSRLPPSGPTPEYVGQSGEPVGDAGSSEAEEMLAEVAAAVQASGRGAQIVGPRRAGQPRTPRWVVAGKLRRGRLK
jgi:hypothetical protein